MVFLEAFLPALSGDIHSQLFQSLLLTPSNLYMVGSAVGTFSLAAIAVFFWEGAAFLTTIFGKSVLPQPKGYMDYFEGLRRAGTTFFFTYLYLLTSFCSILIKKLRGHSSNSAARHKRVVTIS